MLLHSHLAGQDFDAKISLRLRISSVISYRQLSGTLCLPFKMPSVVGSLVLLPILTTFITGSSALQALSNSPCAVQCGNVLGNTTGADIVCGDSDYGSAAGTVFKNCVSCQIGSTYVDPVTKKTDLQLAICMWNIPLHAQDKRT